ncbi:hypothetical protein [Negadavirga shengliensis]|uniref:YD repeat-containing protein n=1 Tax=Negadavirga shengliensis TaxID=1389218 RepID=A0ABV9SW38_9BACT
MFFNLNKRTGRPAFILALYALCIFVLNVQAQEDALNHVTFPSPEAYSLAKFTETPVNLYTGIPEIKVPLYHIKSKGIEMGIDLAYHAGGVKVNEVPGWVGSGWALNAGGVITRSVSGIHDDKPSIGFYYTGSLLNEEWPYPSANYKESYRVGLVDGTPDMFYFNFNGRSGKFYFDNNQKIHTVPYSNLKIELLETGSIYKNFDSVIFGTSGFKKWKITDENGMVYFFEEMELSRSETFILGPNGGYGDVSDLVTAWYLTKIITPNGESEVLLEYDHTSHDTSVSQYDYHSTAIGYYTRHGGHLTHIGSFAENRSSTVTRNYKHQLRKINFLHGEVEFFTSERNDLKHPKAQSGFPSYKLDSVLVKDKEGRLKERFYLDYIEEPSRRLALAKVRKNDQKTYLFDYYNMHLLPDYTSTNTDHWGYFNGASNLGSGLIPTFSYTSQTYEDITYPGINKEPDGEKMKYGTLNKITWPTGGQTVYKYEPNDYSFVNNQPLAEHGWSSWDYIDSSTTPSITFNSLAQVELWYECSTDGIAYGDNIEPCKSVLLPWKFNHTGPFHLTNYIPHNTGEIEVMVKLRYRTLEPGSVTKKYGAGIRIAEIHQRDTENPPIIKRFDYTQEGDSTLSSGVSGTHFSYHVPFEAGNKEKGIYALGVKAYSQSAFPLATTQGNHVGYQRVVEYIEGNGKEVHHFTSFYEFPDEMGIQNSDYEMPLMSKKSNEHKRGKPLKKEVVDESGNLQQWSFTRFDVLFKRNLIKVWESKDFLKFTIQFVGDGNLPDSYEVALTETTAYLIDLESFLPVFDFNYLTGDNGAHYRTETTYRYNEFHQLSYKFFYDSQQKSHSQLLRYPGDYHSPSDAVAMMVYKNIVGVPIESFKSLGNSPYEGTANKWAVKPNGVFQEEILQLEKEGSLSSFAFSKDGSTFSDLFKRKLKFDYDENHNISKVEGKGGSFKSFLWDYSSSMPVAEIQNAERTAVAYTSFETGEKGGWTYTGEPVATASWTGIKCYDLTEGTIRRDNIEAGSENPYKLTFWAKSAEGTKTWDFMGQTEHLDASWKFIEREVLDAPVVISGSNILIDELRLHPANAQMTTYTYDPMVGVTGMTNARNYTVHYEYDDTGRLINIRDEEGELLEHFEYNYRSSN